MSADRCCCRPVPGPLAKGQFRRHRRAPVAVRAPISPRDMVYGRVRTGGVIVYLATSGADSAGGTGVMHLVIVLAGHSCAGIDEIYFDGELAFDADGVAQGRFAGFASVESAWAPCRRPHSRGRR